MKLMLKIILKITPNLVLWAIWGFIVTTIPYPESLTQANFVQIIPFFTSLFLALIFTFNLLLKNILSSASISLGIILLLVLKALDSFNIVTAILIIIAIALLVSYFRKTKKHNPSVNSGLKNLTKQPKIPKLTSLRRNK